MEKTNFESYLEAIQESWKVFKELSSLSQDAIAEIFCIPNTANARAIVSNLPPEQIIKEYNAHQEKLKREKEIGVGDVVYYTGKKEKGLVVETYPDMDGSIRLIVCNGNGHFESWDAARTVKCNKHIEVLDWIKQGIEGAEVIE